MGAIYTNYSDRLEDLNLANLEKRDNLCLRFAKNRLKTEKVKGILKKP